MYFIVNMLNLCYLKCDKYVDSYEQWYIWRLYWIVLHKFCREENKNAIQNLVLGLLRSNCSALLLLALTCFSLCFPVWNMATGQLHRWTRLCEWSMLQYSILFILMKLALIFFSVFANAANTRVLSLPFLWARVNSTDTKWFVACEWSMLYKNSMMAEHNTLSNICQHNVRAFLGGFQA